MKKICFLYCCLSFFYSCQPPSNQEEKFRHINETMEDLLKNSYEFSENHFVDIKDAVRKEGNTALGRKQKAKVALLLKRTDEELDKIEVLKLLLSESNTSEGKGTVRKIMIEEQKGILLEKDLQAYVDWLNKECKSLSGFSELAPLMVDNQEKSNSNGVDQNKSFIETQFEQAGIYEAKAYLTHLQVKIIQYADKAIARIVQGDLSRTFSCFYPLFRVAVLPNQKIVKLGDTLHADLFLESGNWDIIKLHPNQYTIRLDGNPIKPNYKGSTKISFPPASKGKHHWEGVFTIYNKGKDIDFIIHKSYLTLPKNQMDSTLTDFIQGIRRKRY